MALLATAALLAAGCLGRTLPIPPPGAQFSATSDCALADCPLGGVIVTISGVAQPGALVIAENVSQSMRGRRYANSAFGATQVDVDAGRATQLGAYTIRLGPVPERSDRPTPVIISQHGDRITVYQFVASPEGSGWQQSLLLEPPLVVP